VVQLCGKINAGGERQADVQVKFFRCRQVEG